MKKMDATTARQEFSSTINEVAYGHDRVILQRHGRDIAALVPVADIGLIERCEDLEEAAKGGARVTTRVSKRRSKRGK
jgi:prevent-host-death family protein